MITKRPGKDGTITWQVRSRVTGVKKYVGTFPSEKAAKAALQEHEVTQRAIASGELPPELDRTRTLAQAADEWLTSLKLRGSRSEDGYRTRMNVYILPHLGTVPIARLATTHVMRWRDEQSVKFAPATVNGNLTCLSSACSYFVKRQWIAKNPCSGCERVENPARSYAWLRNREEITRLLTHCPGDLRDIAALAAASGLRLDEVLHLQFGDVDLERRLIAVHRGRKGTVKSGKVRYVPILDAVAGMLRERALHRAGALLVFPGQGGGVRSKQGIQSPFKLAVKRAGLDPALRFHDLRHTFASHWMMDAGCIFKLSKILGHHSVRVTEATYAHLSPTAFDEDLHRVGFHVPAEAAVYKFERDATTGRLTARTLSVVPDVGQDDVSARVPSRR